LVHILQKKCPAARFTYSTAGYLSPGEEDEEEKEKEEEEEEEEDGERPETQEQQSRQEQHEHKQHSKKTCALPLTSRQPQTSCEQKHCKTNTMHHNSKPRDVLLRSFLRHNR